jgi:hypothetical protein
MALPTYRHNKPTTYDLYPVQLSVLTLVKSPRSRQRRARSTKLECESEAFREKAGKQMVSILSWLEIGLKSKLQSHHLR